MYGVDQARKHHIKAGYAQPVKMSRLIDGDVDHFIFLPEFLKDVDYCTRNIKLWEKLEIRLLFKTVIIDYDMSCFVSPSLL